MIRRAIVTAGLAVLGLLNLAWGIWATVAPRHFFDTFPGLGQRWTAAYPPYNVHLVSDLGATFTMIGILLGLAAVLHDRRVTAVVLVGVLTFNVLHLVFHASHHGLLSGGPLAGSLTALAVGVVGPAVLLLLALLPDRARAAD